jgi:hypothetical protein
MQTQTNEGEGQSHEALTSTTISNSPPDGIAYSTGNVYFTTHYTEWVFGGWAPGRIIFPHPVQVAAVKRTGKYSVPGQEITLWSEIGSRFGDVVWALVDGTFYGYFFAQNLSTAQVTIKRVPLAGGTAVDVAGGIGNNIDIVNGHHLLDTDGTNLYWQDVSTVRSMPIGGGPQTILDSYSPMTPNAGISVVGGNVYYASSNSVIYVPTTGSALPPSSRTLFSTATSRIVTLTAVPYGSDTMVAWGMDDSSGAFLLAGTMVGIKPVDGFLATSLAQTGGEAFAYTECNNSGCNLGGSMFGTNAVSSGAFGLGIDSSTPGTITGFWGDVSGVHRTSAPVIQ